MSARGTRRKALPSAAPSLALSAPVPEAWQTWGSPGASPTIDDLLVEMNKKVCCETLHAPTEAAILETTNRLIETWSDESFSAVTDAHQQQSIAFTAQSLRRGYAIGMTREYATRGLQNTLLVKDQEITVQVERARDRLSQLVFVKLQLLSNLVGEWQVTALIRATCPYDSSTVEIKPS